VFLTEHLVLKCLEGTLGITFPFHRVFNNMVMTPSVGLNVEYYNVNYKKY